MHYTHIHCQYVTCTHMRSPQTHTHNYKHPTEKHTHTHTTNTPQRNTHTRMHTHTHTHTANPHPTEKHTHIPPRRTHTLTHTHARTHTLTHTHAHTTNPHPTEKHTHTHTFLQDYLQSEVPHGQRCQDILSYRAQTADPKLRRYMMELHWGSLSASLSTSPPVQHSVFELGRVKNKQNATPLFPGCRTVVQVCFLNIFISRFFPSPPTISLHCRSISKKEKMGDFKKKKKKSKK